MNIVSSNHEDRGRDWSLKGQQRNVTDRRTDGRTLKDRTILYIKNSKPTKIEFKGQNDHMSTDWKGRQQSVLSPVVANQEQDWKDEPPMDKINRSGFVLQKITAECELAPIPEEFQLRQSEL
ncbi:hypothetical protein DPMN_084722 [Dreissena polymorpha]|uniref:Uncharacterized protein n=1 Tax=Dreissena polymorpha TaxID=45954 RepID=A0A9D3YDN6_DREPO|nr:hypothetical protein DPMN_084722 [Dreissena polymorpha]